MKTNAALFVLLSFAPIAVWGQQSTNTPSAAELSTAPRRYSAEEMAKFQAIHSQSSQPKLDYGQASDQPGVHISLGDSEEAPSRNSSARRSVARTSFNEPVDETAKPQEPSAGQAAVPHEPQALPVPAILSGQKTTGQMPATNAGPMPQEVTMNPGAVRSAQSPGVPLSSSAPKAVAPPTSQAPEKFKSQVFSMAPSMPKPGQPPIDLRRPTDTLHQASRPQDVEGGIEKVSAQQESTDLPLAEQGGKLPVNASPGLPVNKSAFSSPNTSASSLRDGASQANSVTAKPTGTLVGPLTNRNQAGGLSDESTTIHTPGALVQVATTGPKSISIGKNAAYEIVASNSGQTAAQQVEVSFTVPSWIELSNMNVSVGSKDLVRESDATRVLWRIDRLEANSSQRMSLDVIPRKAQVFDLNVEWSVAPLAGAVQVQVTEPLLKMSITGPDEVQFGQSALYSIAIRNPGTGVAENVCINLSEALGGERAALGNIGPGEEKNIQVELIARSAGALDLSANVSGDGNLQDTTSKSITVRRAQLDIAIEGPKMKYAGGTGNFVITVENSGDAIAQDVYAAIGLPVGAQYLSGIEAAERIDGGMRWAVGALPPGGKRSYTVACQLNTAGPMQIEAGVRGTGDLAAATSFQTMIETVADLVLDVEDPQGPLPVGQDVVYQIRIKNRGTKAATNVNVVVHFSNGIEPTAAEGRNHEINPGEVVFETIGQLEPNDEMVFNVTARANLPGTHMFRAQLNCDDADAREVTQGTTKFFGEDGTEVNTADPSLQVGEQPMQPQPPSNNIMR